MLESRGHACILESRGYKYAGERMLEFRGCIHAGILGMYTCWNSGDVYMLEFRGCIHAGIQGMYTCWNSGDVYMLYKL